MGWCHLLSVEYNSFFIVNIPLYSPWQQLQHGLVFSSFNMKEYKQTVLYLTHHSHLGWLATGPEVPYNATLTRCSSSASFWVLSYFSWAMGILRTSSSFRCKAVKFSCHWLWDLLLLLYPADFIVIQPFCLHFFWAPLIVDFDISTIINRKNKEIKHLK